jgi:hypothetical protein
MGSVILVVSAPSLATLLRFSHLCAMATDFSLFRDRFTEACRVRDMKPEAVYRSVGIGGRRALDLQSVGVLRALDLYRVCQIADRLDVSLDWLLGRSDVMELPKTKTASAPKGHIRC